MNCLRLFFYETKYSIKKYTYTFCYAPWPTVCIEWHFFNRQIIKMVRKFNFVGGLWGVSGIIYFPNLYFFYFYLNGFSEWFKLFYEYIALPLQFNSSTRQLHQSQHLIENVLNIYKTVMYIIVRQFIYVYYMILNTDLQIKLLQLVMHIQMYSLDS